MPDWTYLARIRPNVVRAGEPLTIHIDRAKLVAKEANITLELWEIDTWRVWNKATKRWVWEDGDLPTGPDNPDDLLATWKGELRCVRKGDAVEFHFEPSGPAKCFDGTERDRRPPNMTAKHVLGASIPITFPGSRPDWVYYIPVPFDDTKDQGRTGEGPHLDLAIVLKRGDEVLYRSDEIVSFVSDFRWWAPTSFAPPRAGNDFELFVDGEEYFARLYKALIAATTSIYITDWKMSPYIALNRTGDPPEPPYPAGLGFPSATKAKGSASWVQSNLLRVLGDAAQKGCDVRVLLWKSPGPQFQENYEDMVSIILMENGIKCAWHNHEGDKNPVGLFWSHHQKTVIIDDKFAFVGGLDLAQNRFDNPTHAPYDYRADANSGYLINDEKKKHFYRCSGYHVEDHPGQIGRYFHLDPARHKDYWRATSRKAFTDRPRLMRDWNPRMGWHDVHCEVSGPSAIDVTRNFAERWNVAIRDTKKSWANADGDLDAQPLKGNVGDIPGMSPGGAVARIKSARREAEACRDFKSVAWWDSFLPAEHRRGTDRRSWGELIARLKKVAPDMLVELSQVNLSRAPEPGGAVVQVTRSVHEHALKMDLPQDWIDNRKERHKKAEASIHESYLRAIDNAEHYVYIESQMFISASVGDGDYRRHINELEAPVFGQTEIENQIAPRLLAKIEKKLARDEPFNVYVILPEIYDGDPLTSASREIQARQAMTMGLLRDAVDKAATKHGKDGRDYLSYFALRAVGVSTDGDELVRSHLVYVHSKLMIVDDVFVTMGSANINDRSLAGYRDSELNVSIVGARDEDVILGGRPWKANEKIRDFRMRLFREHLGDAFPKLYVEDPARPMALRRIRDHAHSNFKLFHELHGKEVALLEAFDAHGAGRQQRNVNADLGRDNAGVQRQLDELEVTQQKLIAEARALHRKLVDVGHLIIHPYQERSESRGGTKQLFPDNIAN